MKIGMLGLGRMGLNMSFRLVAGGHDVVVWNRSGGPAEEAEKAGASRASDPAALVKALSPPRVAWVMLPAGLVTEGMVQLLADEMEPGDIVIDGGNSNFHDSVRRANQLAEKEIGFIDAGTSGGVWGLENGYCLMVGGDPKNVSVVKPAFDTLAPKDGFVHAGPAGAGHFTKMVHNGVEYGMMQSLGEGYELLKASELGVDVPAAMAAWRYGSVVRSWLLDLLVDSLNDDPQLEKVKGWAEDSGEGRWTIDEAVRLGVPMHVISAALFERFASRQDDSPAMKVIAALRNQFGGHAIKGADA